MERGIANTRELTIPVDDGIELRPVSITDCADLYAAIDRNRARSKNKITA